MRRPAHSTAVRLEREAEVARVFIEEGLGWLVSEAGLSRFDPVRAIKREPPDDVSAEVRVRRALTRLGVTFIKGGQALSTRTDIITPELSAELAKLQDEVPPEPFETMRAMIELELEMPLTQAFAEFDETPIGSASIGQVYKAALPDGTPVAVKVQRPGVRELAEVDLDIAFMLAARAQAYIAELRGSDLVGLTREFADAFRGEFDYAREAGNVERTAAILSDNETVVVPEVYWSHTTSKVLTLGLLDGVRMNRPDELDAAGFDRGALALNGIRAYLHMIFEDGFFHADPHPGNFLALPGDRVGFTDFGRVGTLSHDSRDRFVDLMYSVVNCDDEAAADTLLALSRAPDIDEVALQRDTRKVISRYYGRELHEIDMGELLADALGLIRTHHLGMPSDFALIIATLTVLEGLGTMLDPSFDFVSAVQPFVDRAMRERYSASALVDRAGRDARRAVRTLERLPLAVDRILRRASHGQFRVEFAPREYQPVLDELAELVNRVAFAIVVAALIVGASNIFRAEGLPQWVYVAAEIGLVAALGVTGWFFGSIIYAHTRARRRR